MSTNKRVAIFSLGLLLTIQLAYVAYINGPKKYEVASTEPAPKAEPTFKLDEPPKKSNDEEDEKKSVTGRHLEWTVPSDTTKIRLKYKEKNGRLKQEYEFRVNPGERIEIGAR